MNPTQLSLDEQKSLFELQVLNYFIMAADPSFASLKKIYTKAVKLNMAQRVYDIYHNGEYSKGNGLQADLEYFKVI